MPDKNQIQDPLKPLDQICDPNSRQRNFVSNLEDLHANLSNIVLDESVPVDVRQLFETAKNLSLYSWFAYRFHQVSELIAFSAMEMALRVRYLEENPIDPETNKPRPTLHKLMMHAKKEKWITNEGFPSLYTRAKYAAEQKISIELIQSHDFEKEPSVTIDEPSEEEIIEALNNLDMVEAITINAHKIRNDLAHGSSTLHPNSVSTLFTVSEVINQIYF